MGTKNEVRALREELGMSREEFADELGVAHGYLYNLERGGDPLSHRVAMALQRIRIAHGLIDNPWTPDVAALVTYFNKMSPQRRALALAVVETMSTAPDEAAKG